MKRLLSLLLIVVLLAACSKGSEKKKARQHETKKEGQVLVVASFGGSFQDAQRKAFFRPFMAQTGIRIREISYDGSYEKLAAQVRSGTVNWDVIDVESTALARGIRDKIFEPIPDDIGKGIKFVPGSRSPYGIGADIYATIIAYRKGDPHPPNSWADFFNVAAFPGPRSLRRSPRTTLEIGLLADGVAPGQLYPLDINRAFTVLDRIKPQIRVWWTSGQQPIDLLEKGTVRMAVAWSGRVWAAKRAGEPIAASLNQGIVETEYWVILKGSPHRAAALKFIQFTLRPKRQAEMTRLFGVGPTNMATLDILPKDILRDLPSSRENLRREVIFNPVWWANNEKAVQNRWERWLAE